MLHRIIPFLHPHPQPRSRFLQPSTWVEFTSGAFISPSNLIVPGMLGQVVDTPGAAYVCTPGISTMITPLGAKQPYGYLDTSFSVLEAEPDEVARESSRELWRNALAAHDAHHGYTGWVQIPGNPCIEEEKGLKEMEQLTRRVIEWVDVEGRENDVRGTARRVVRLLRAFERHSLGGATMELARVLEDAIRSGTVHTDLLEQVCTWRAQAHDARPPSGKYHRTRPKNVP